MKSVNLAGKLPHRRTSSKRRCLRDFQTDSQINIFEQSDAELPEVLASKIQGPSCCKVVKDRSHGHLLFFTYHYLSLCFNSKDPIQSTKYLDFIYELIEKPEFDLILPEQKNELTQSSTITLKNIMSQYLNYMSSNSQSILKSFSKYPAILQIFVYFFYSLLFLGQVCNHYEENVSMQATYEFLTSYFDMEVSFGNDYAHFLNSNMCVFEESPEEIYIFIGVREKDDHSLIGQQENYGTQNIISTLGNISEDSLDVLISSKKQCQTKLPLSKYSKRREPAEQLENLAQNSQKIESGVSFNYTESQKTANIDAFPSKENIVEFQDQENSKNLQNNVTIESYEENQSSHLRSRSEFFQGSYQSEASTSNGSYTQKNYFKDIKNTHHKYQASSHFPPKPTKNEINKFSFNTLANFFRPIQTPILAFCGSPKAWVSQNITKQYTSSFILEAMPEPYRTSIQSKKQRARKIRNSAYTFLA